MVELSMGFWDAVAGGETWTNPVLAILGSVNAGINSTLILAADGSKSRTGQYLYGRLLVKRSAIPIEPSVIKHRLVRLLVYSRVSSDRTHVTPPLVALDVQLLPDKWEPPTKSFANHPSFRSPYAWNDPNTSAESSRSNSKRQIAEADDIDREHIGASFTTDFADGPDAPTDFPGKRLRRIERNESRRLNCAGPITRENRGILISLPDLHMYANHCVIKGRVTHKSEIRSFTNAQGESSLFYIHVMDAQKCEIRATFFGRAVMWHDIIVIGRIYAFSNGTVQRANKAYNSLSHECELKFDSQAEIVPLDDDGSFPVDRFIRTLLCDLQQLAPGTLVDVVAAVTALKKGEIILTRRRGEELNRREMTLTDSSNTSVTMVLWGGAGSVFSKDLQSVPIVSIKRARVTVFAGILSLSSTSFTTFAQTLDEAACEIERSCWKSEEAWWLREGAQLRETSMSLNSTKLMLVQEIRRHVEALRSSSRRPTLFFETKAFVHDIVGEKLTWLGCPICKRKVIQERAPTVVHRCANCKKTVEPSPWLFLTLELVDESGALRCVALADKGQEVMNPLHVTAVDLQRLEAGGIDTRGRSLADVLEGLLYSELKLKLSARHVSRNGVSGVQFEVRGASWSHGSWEVQIEHNLRCIESHLEVL